MNDWYIKGIFLVTVVCVWRGKRKSLKDFNIFKYNDNILEVDYGRE